MSSQLLKRERIEFQVREFKAEIVENIWGIDECIE